MEDYNHNIMKYYLATNEVDIFHYGELQEGMEFTTGQPVSFLYNTKEELIAKLAEYDHEYQEPQDISTLTEFGDPGEPPVIEPEVL